MVTFNEARENLEWVKAQILANPDKYDQNQFGDYHGCGTVGCIAGWLDVKKNGMEVHNSRPWMETGTTDLVSTIAASLILPNKKFCAAVNELFQPFINGEDEDGPDANAAAGITKINKYLDVLNNHETTKTKGH